MKHYLSPDNKVFAYEANGSQDHIIPSTYTPITQAQATERSQQAQQAMFDALTYSDKRKSEYPAIGDQLDALYHAGVFPADMAARLKEVKDKYPK
jgi:hypothetical protein